MTNKQKQRSWRTGVRFNLAGYRASAILGLLVAFGWNYVLAGPTHMAGGTFDLADPHAELKTIAAEWSVIIILAIIAFGVQKRRLSDFGLGKFGRRELRGMVVALVAAYILIGVASRFIAMPSSVTSPDAIRRLATVPLFLRFGLVLTAAICEEFMYRGFGIEELAGLTGSVWVAGLISWLCFSFAHVRLYGLGLALIVPAILGGFLTLLYLWRRNLPVCMLMHFILDGFSLLVLPMLLTGHVK